MSAGSVIGRGFGADGTIAFIITAGLSPGGEMAGVHPARARAPTFKNVNWGAMVRQAWGDEWHKKEIAYEFSSGRKFNDSGAQGGPYSPEDT